MNLVGKFSSFLIILQKDASLRFYGTLLSLQKSMK